MKINYKEPYWVKFEWEMNEHHDNQYVTNFDKVENLKLNQFLYNDFILTCQFKIEPHHKTDNISMVFGKPGKNMGLTYNRETTTIAFEYWTKDSPDDKFNFLQFRDVSQKDIESGMILSIIRNGNILSLYKNFEEVNKTELETDFVEDYAINSLFLGCSSPQSNYEKHRYHGELDITHFSIVENHSDILISKDIFECETHQLVSKYYYYNILCLYDFENINNLGIVYDESSHNNFLEKVPTDFVL